MDAIVLAGGIPQPDEPLYGYTKGDPKALIDVAGKPMIQWVLDALNGSKGIGNIIVAGLSPKTKLNSRKPLYFIPNQGRMLSNIVVGVEKSLTLNKKGKYVMIVSADIPALKANMVDWLIQTCMKTKDDLYYGVCPRDVMEKRFKGSKRTYTRIKDMELCGADMNIAHVSMTTDHLDMWESLIGSRKSPLNQARIIGWGLLWSVFTKNITLNELAARISERIGIKGRAIVWPDAEPCMDVDKPHQLELLRKDLAKQNRKSASKKVVKKDAPKKKQKTKAKPKKR